MKQESGLKIFKVGAVIKFERQFDRFEIYNRLRAIEGVIIVTPKDMDKLKSKSTERIEYGYASIKFDGGTNPVETMRRIVSSAIKGSNESKRIDGLINIHYRENNIQAV